MKFEDMSKSIEESEKLEPSAVNELGTFVRSMFEQNLAVSPVGGRTMPDIGLAPTKKTQLVSIVRLDQVIDYPARDMTITVQAGITIWSLRKILAAENQRLPVDVPIPDRATLGGALATNASGPRRYGFGTLRDYLIGVSFINYEGHEVKAGGRVVKNVAGYDVCKLMIGSLGTLGIITQATLKVKPCPEEAAFLLTGCSGEELESLLQKVHESRTRPVCFELLNRKAADLVASQTGVQFSDHPYTAIIGFEDNRASVRWQVEQLANELGEKSPTEIIWKQNPKSELLWNSLADLQVGHECLFTIKANVLSCQVASICRGLTELPEKPSLQAHAGNGILFCHFGPGPSLERTKEIVNQLQDQAIVAQGNAIILTCPAEWKSELPIWGIPRGDAWLMRKIKQQFDPKGIFNPGKFVDGI